MMALDLKPGDEVITADFTYVATAEVIGLLGLKPVLVDVVSRYLRYQILLQLKKQLLLKQKRLFQFIYSDSVPTWIRIMAVGKKT
jgi:aspartate/methionine/tyrosine aminotransferase